MQEIDISANRLISILLSLPEPEKLCILDSCGVGHLGSHLLIAGISPVETYELSYDDPEQTLALLDERLADPNLAAIFTISYDFGQKLHKIHPQIKDKSAFSEPDVFLALFDCLIIHDYDSRKTFVSGNTQKIQQIAEILSDIEVIKSEITTENALVNSNISKTEYLACIEKIKDFIRSGDTYQTNLTRQIRAELPAGLTPEQIFYRLRRNHPAPFAAFLRRADSTVISASPERFIQACGQTMRTSPVKGTRPRGNTADEDAELRSELLNSEKDRAENTMIVDLLRNDLGRICEYGSVEVEKLCDLEEHPSLFHLVSTISGKLRDGVKYSDILKAVFPCGSITGAPKLSTMRIINELETAPRGLSMGAIGYRIPGGPFSIGESFDMSVAIRTMVVRGREAVFNVGGGIVIDSDAESEYDESLIKATALLDAVLSSRLSVPLH